jgi:hypothetical protein
MKIDRILKSYYRDRIEAFSPRPEIKRPLLERAQAAPGERSFALRPTLVFYFGLIAALAVMLWSNAGTIRSLERIDPENRRIRRVEQALHDGLTAVWTAAMQPASPPDKGGSS